VFTEKGQLYWLRVFEIPEGAKNSKGRPVQNLLPVVIEDKIKAFVNVADLTDKEYVENKYIVFCTEKGIIKKTALEAYSRPRQNGIIAINIREGDSLLKARLTDGNSEILIALQSGRAIRFPESKVRPMGRSASGVKGITLANDKDNVVGMVCLSDKSEQILVVSEKGYGKRSEIEDYRVTNRGGKGVKTINITEKTGKLVTVHAVKDGDELMIINESGIAIRIMVSDLRVMGRATQGVKLINLSKNDSIASVAKIAADLIDDDEVDETEITDETTENTSDDNTEDSN
jgi:DNA gyrase subunit A